MERRASEPESPAGRRLIIDTDPGVDDFLAIMMALRSPELQVDALTTVGGNAPLRYTTRNALRALEHCGRAEIPVAAGQARGLGGPFTYAPYFHGSTGLTARMPVPRTRPVGQHAVELIWTWLQRTAVPRTIVALGPLSNIARLVTDHAGAAPLIDELIVMGGALDRPGNVTSYAEFNLWNDPVSAEIALKAGISVTLVGLDVCERVRLRRGDIVEAEPVVKRLMDGWFAIRRPGDSMALCDPLAVAAAICPDLLEYEDVEIEIDSSHLLKRGAIKRASGGHRMKTAVDVDEGRAVHLIRERMLRPGTRSLK